MSEGNETDHAESIDRRHLLSVIGGGAATTLLGTEVSAAKPGHGNGKSGNNGNNGNSDNNGNNGVGPCTCDGCPEGTFCGKLEGTPEEGETYTFESDGDSFSVTIESVTEKDEDEVTCFSFSTDDVVEQVCVKGGPDTTTYSDDPEGDELCAPTNPGGQQAAISNVSLCGKADELECYQIDLVAGEVIRDFGDEGAYGDRKFEDFSVCEDGSNLKGLESGNDGTEAVNCTLSWEGLGFKDGDNTVNVDVTLESAESKSCKVTLAGYLLPEGETEFNPKTLEEQEYRDNETVELHVSGSETLQIDLDG